MASTNRHERASASLYAQYTGALRHGDTGRAADIAYRAAIQFDSAGEYELADVWNERHARACGAVR